MMPVVGGSPDFASGRPRRVLMTTDTVGGVWTYAIELSRQLIAAGIEVGLAAMGDLLTERQMEALDSVPELRVWCGRYRLEWMRDPWDDVRRSGDWLLEIEQRFQPDLVHLNGLVHGALPWSAPALTVGHSCVFSWWQQVRGTEPPREWERYREEVTRSLRHSRMVIAPSASMLKWLEANYGPFERTRVIYNGRDPARFRVGDKENFLLTAGRLWDDAKNLSALARIADRLSWPVLAAGETALANVGEWTGGSAGIRMLGALSENEMGETMSRASLFVSPARYEPFGLGVLEAALCGCALVLSDIPTFREIWGAAATFVPSDDSEALRDAIEDLIENPGKRFGFGQRARSHALGFHPVRMLDGYLQAYSAVSTGAGGAERYKEARVG